MSVAAAGSRTWLSEADCDLDDFRALVEQVTHPRDYPLADSVDRNVPLYDGDRLRALAASPERRREVQAELVRAFGDGPGIVVFKRAFADLFELIPDMTAEVHRWGATADGVLIEFTVRGTAGGSPISWQAVDRFVLNEDGLATERFTYFDSLPLVLALVRRPRAWPGFTRSRIKQMWR